MFFFCSIGFTSVAKDFTVVIDPGHGGNDYGAIGITSYEKNINLDIALKLGELIKKNMPDVKVVFTRDNDTFIPLQERAAIANRSKGDLFISIHTNSVDKKSKNRTTISGASTYTLGLHRTQENLEVAKRENSVISLENDYTTSYKGFDPSSTESYIIFEINQSKHMAESVELASNIQNEFITNADRMDKGVRQAGFLVLAATSMPAVLVELDFICNPTQEKFLISDDGQNKMAQSIYNAFRKYKASRDAKITVMNKPADTKLANNKVANNKDKAKASTDNYSNLEENDALSESRLSIRKGEKKSSKKGDKNNKKKESRDKENMKASPVAKAEVKNVATVAAPQAKKKEVKNYDNKSGETSLKDYPNMNSPKSSTAPDNRIDKLNKANEKDVVCYQIQFLTSAVKLPANSPHFKNVSPVSFYKENGLYKYTFGETTDKNEATRMLGMIKSKFKEAFIISIKNGQRIY